MTLYAKELAGKLSAAIDVTKLAEAWQALHPKDVSKAASPAPDRSGCQLPGTDRTRMGHARSVTSPQGWHQHTVTRTAGGSHVTKAIDPALSAFLAAAREAILRVLRAVLPRAWTEGWVLGQIAAQAVSAGVQDVDWGAWTPGDYEAAEAIAGPGLRQLLAAQDITIKSMAETRLEELAAVLEATLASDVAHRPPLPEPLPPQMSVGSLAAELRDVLDNPERSWLVAQAEIGRAQAEAARVVYAEAGTAEVEISTAEDDKVCPVCEAAAKVGAHPLGTPPMVLLHPRCRCAELPVLAGAS